MWPENEYCINSELAARFSNDDLIFCLQSVFCMNVQQKIVCQGTKLDDTNTIHVKSAVTLVSLLHVCLSVCLSAVQGILTGVSRGGFSLSINERDLGGDPIVDALEAVLRHAYSPTHLARKVSLISDLPWSCILRPFTALNAKCSRY